MTKKEQMLTFFREMCQEDGEYFSVLVETRGSKGLELILNPFSNLEEKIAYYDKAYDDNLVLKSYDGIKIVSWDSCSENCQLYCLLEPFMKDKEE